MKYKVLVYKVTATGKELVKEVIREPTKVEKLNLFALLRVDKAKKAIEQLNKNHSNSFLLPAGYYRKFELIEE